MCDCVDIEKRGDELTNEQLNPLFSADAIAGVQVGLQWTKSTIKTHCLTIST